MSHYKLYDELAEWLRRWTANLMCSERVGSSPILVVLVFKCIVYTRVCKHSLQTGTFFEHICDEVAEWLRRWTANPMYTARLGSSPILVLLVF